MAMNKLAALLSGVLFGLGLIGSDMINPVRVKGFLDWFGHWDPTLAFVMAGALSVTIPSFYLLRKLDKPLLTESFQMPSKKDLDGRLITGAILFGVGWGLAGLCPGPAIVVLPTMLPKVFVFVAALCVGMLLFALWDQRGQSTKSV
jgi:uncharacterized membrane protein YedE/YeeE